MPMLKHHQTHASRALKALLPVSMVAALSMTFGAAIVVPASRVEAQGAAADTKDSGTKNSGLVLDRIAAVVNDEIILQSELMSRFAPMSQSIDQIPDARERRRRASKLKYNILNELINEELIAQSALESGLKVDPKEIQAAIDDIKTQNNLDDTQFAEALRSQGMSMSAYRKDLRRQIIRMRAVSTTVRPKVNVTDDDVKAAFEDERSSSEQVAKVLLQHILVKLAPGATEDERDKAQARAAEIVVKAKAGEDFAALAAEYSDDEATKNAKGELGWIERGTIASEWEDVVFSMKPKQTRGPVAGPNGLHIFHIAESETEEVKGYEESKNEIHTRLFRNQMEKQTQIWLESLREKAYIDIKQST